MAAFVLLQNIDEGKIEVTVVCEFVLLDLFPHITCAFWRWLQEVGGGDASIDVVDIAVMDGNTVVTSSNGQVGKVLRYDATHPNHAL